MFGLIYSVNPSHCNNTMTKPRRSFIRKIGLATILFPLTKLFSTTSLKKLPNNENCAVRDGSCPGHVDCQGFVPPCENCNDPDNWNAIATKRKDQSFKNFWTITRLKFSNFFKPNSK